MISNMVLLNTRPNNVDPRSQHSLSPKYSLLYSLHAYVWALDVEHDELLFYAKAMCRLHVAKADLKELHLYWE